MKVCTFFGHRDCPESIQDDLKAVLTKLIAEQGVELFYTGNQGQFDAMARYVLRGLAQDYPHIRYAVVLAYMPGKASEYEDHSGAMTGCSSRQSAWEKRCFLWQNFRFLDFLQGLWYHFNIFSLSGGSI